MMADSLNATYVLVDVAYHIIIVIIVVIKIVYIQISWSDNNHIIFTF